MKKKTPLKQARAAKKMTLERVASLINSDAGNLSRIENGKQIPSKDLLSKLVMFYNDEGITEIHIIYPERFIE